MVNGLFDSSWLCCKYKKLMYLPPLFSRLFVSNLSWSDRAIEKHLSFGLRKLFNRVTQHGSGHYLAMLL